MNTRFLTARGLEGHAEVPVVRGAESAVGAKLNPRGAELDVGEVVQGRRVGGAVGPCDWYVGETPVAANAMAAVNGAVRAQNDCGAAIVAGK